MKEFVILCALGSSTLAAPGFAQCWDSAQLAASKVRDLQTSLMADTLRCNAAGIDVSSHYNGFVSARRAQLDLANATLKAHFSRTGGPGAYDHFTTSLANAYGGGATSQAECDEAAQTADDGAASQEAFLDLADQRSAPPGAMSGACALTVASTRTTAAPSDAEVAAALDVLNRYHQIQGATQSGSVAIAASR